MDAGHFKAQKVNLRRTTMDMKTRVRFISLTGWLVPVALALIFFARWINEIVVPTLKGGNFNHLYDIYRVSYLHATIWFVCIAFVWVALIAVWLAKPLSK
jgi:hypothetical protein